ncbi:MAG: TonB-dependent receptor, partial [Bacteroidaceae bacterium]
FAFQNLRIGGPYTVEISYVGFNPEKISNISLVLGEERILNATMREDALALGEVLVIGDKNPIISGNRTGAQEIITRDKMDKLPTLNRSLTDFTKLTPMSSGGNFAGTSYRFNNVTVDGASFNNSFGLASSLGAKGTEPISLEAIEQVQVMIAPYDVRNGAFTGAGINSVTKSGTNEFTGTAYWYVKSPGMQGLRQKTVKVEKGDFKNNSFGISLGGPIIKNKLFFYINGEMDRQEEGISYRARTDANAEIGNGTSSTDLATMNDLSQFLQTNLNYNPGSPSLRNTEVYADRITARVDWNINSKNALSFKYFYLKSYNDNNPSTSGAIGNSRGPNENTIPFSSSYYKTHNNFNIFMADLVSNLGNGLSNTLKVGYSAMRDFRSMDGGYFPQVDILNEGGGSIMTTFGTEANSYNNKLNSDVYQLQDNFEILRGNHQITIGTQSDYRSFKNGFAQDYSGSWVYNSMQDFKDDVTKYKDYLAGGSQGVYESTASKYSGSYSMTDDFPFAKVNVLSLGLYAQDKWKITPNFTFTYGLRIDMPIFLTDLDANPALEGVEFQNGIKIDVSKYPKTKPLFSPRIGFNWDVFSDRSFQVRGGTGLFSGTPPYVWLSNQAGNNGLLFGKTYAYKGGMPFGFTGEIGIKPADMKAAKGDIAITDRDFKYPQLWKTNLAIDKEFGDGWVATIEVLYNKDLNAIYHSNIAMPSADSEFAYQLTNPGDNAVYDNRTIYAKKFLNGDKANNVIMMKNTNKGYSIYTTLQLQKEFRRGTMKGLALNGSYTFGKSRGVTDGS